MGAITLDGMIKKHGEEEGKIRYSNWKNSLKGQGTLSWYIAKYGEKIGADHYEKRKELNRIKNTLEWYINRFGEIEGPLKYAEKNSKLSVSVRALKKNGFSDEEIAKIRQTQATKSAMTLENFISRYGEIEGTLKYQNWLSKAKERSNTTVQYWIKKGYSEEESKLILKKRQATSTLDKFISKYGEEEGTKKYLDVNKRKTANWKCNTHVSNLEKHFLDNLSKITYIDNKGRQCRLKIKEKVIFCDYLCAEKNRIIEIHGDFWHMNPNMYESYDLNRITNSCAQEKWDSDFSRKSALEDLGYDIMIIWESELNENYESCLSRAKIFLEK